METRVTGPAGFGTLANMFFSAAIDASSGFGLPGAVAAVSAWLAGARS
jgi:hypothetical protein